MQDCAIQGGHRALMDIRVKAYLGKLALCLLLQHSIPPAHICRCLAASVVAVVPWLGSPFVLVTARGRTNIKLAPKGRLKFFMPVYIYEYVASKPAGNRKYSSSPSGCYGGKRQAGGFWAQKGRRPVTWPGMRTGVHRQPKSLRQLQAVAAKCTSVLLYRWAAQQAKALLGAQRQPCSIANTAPRRAV